MTLQNQKLHLRLSMYGILIAVIVRGIHYLSLFPHEHSLNLDTSFYTMFIMMSVVYLLNVAVYMKKRIHWFPWINSLHLALTSITIIVAGNGMVEYHFSIFMVMAVVTFYQRISLIVFMTGIFAVQHFGSYLFMPEFAYGKSEYPFSMVAIHAALLVLTAAANMAQILQKRKDWSVLEEENNNHKQTIDKLIGKLSKTSISIENHARELLKQTANNNQQSEVIYQQTLSISEQTKKNLQMASHVSFSVENMDVEIQQIAGHTTKLVEDSDSTIERAARGTELVQRAIQQMEQVSASSQSANGIMNDLVVRANNRHYYGDCATNEFTGAECGH
jgi:hypothetical protein